MQRTYTEIEFMYFRLCCYLVQMWKCYHWVLLTFLSLAISACNLGASSFSSSYSFSILWSLKKISHKKKKKYFWDQSSNKKTSSFTKTKLWSILCQTDENTNFIFMFPPAWHTLPLVYFAQGNKISTSQYRYITLIKKQFIKWSASTFSS